MSTIQNQTWVIFLAQTVCFSSKGLECIRFPLFSASFSQRKYSQNVQDSHTLLSGEETLSLNPITTCRARNDAPSASLSRIGDSLANLIRFELIELPQGSQALQIKQGDLSQLWKTLVFLFCSPEQETRSYAARWIRDYGRKGRRRPEKQRSGSIMKSDIVFAHLE